MDSVRRTEGREAGTEDNLDGLASDPRIGAGYSSYLAIYSRYLANFYILTKLAR